MLEPLSLLFPDDDENRTIEEEMSDFKVILKHNTKVYKPKDGDPKVVWTFGECVAKLREARKTDPWLAAAAEKCSDFHDKYSAGDKMIVLWMEDCEKIWRKAYDYVMSEPAPEAPPEEAPQEAITPVSKKGIFGRNNG